MVDDRNVWNNDPPDAEDTDAENLDTEYPLLTDDDFDQELEALAAYASDQDFGFDEEAQEQDEGDEDFEDSDDLMADDEAGDETEIDGAEADQQFDDLVADEVESLPGDEYAAQTLPDAGDEPESAPVVDDEDRLRQPRAGRFRRTLRNQLGMLPLALLMIALGAYLIARGQDVSGLPDLSDSAIAVIAVLTVGFTAVFYAFLFGRRERGLLFVGLWILTTAGLITALVYGLDEDPSVREWWPLLLWSLGFALVFTYVVERTHDVRLLLLSVMALVAGTTAYLVSSEQLDNDALRDAADYWPLLLAVAGVGLLPLVFRRRTE